MTTSTDDLIEHLTPEQREAVLHHEGPLLVIAGPGAGKTEVMIRRVAYLIRHRGIPPEALLVTTFTRKATEELRCRLFRFLGHDVDRILITTIHGFCQQLLEANPRSHPYGRSFQVLDEPAQFLFVFSHAKQLGLDLPKGRLGDFLGDVVAAFNAYGEELLDPARLIEALRDPGADEAGLIVAEAYSRYLELLSAEQTLDFAGLQREAYGLLQRDQAVLGSIRDRFQHIVVDEHQDTNVLQDLIIRIVAYPRNNVCVVGDDDQGIYRFRGATVQNFLGFPTVYPEARRIELGRNFRSTQQIVEATIRLIEKNPVRYPKSLVAHRGPGPEVLVVAAEDVDDEGERLSDLIHSLHRNRTITCWSDIAVLFSSVKYYAKPLLKGFQQREIPYTVTGDGGFFDREDIRQLRDLIMAFAWPKYWRLEMLDTPLLNLQPQTFQVLSVFKGDIWTLDSAGLRGLGVEDDRDLALLADLIALQRKVQAREHATILGLVHDLLAATGYVAGCILSDDEVGLLNIAQFTQLAQAFDRHGRSRSPYRFGEYLRSLPERSLDDLQRPLEDTVQVMTIHKAKGLEFPVVVIGSVIEGRLPNRERQRRFHIDQELAPKVMPPEVAARRQEQDDSLHISDQRRLLYVGLTRARDLLIVGTSAKVRQQRCKPSRFLAEMCLEPSELPTLSKSIEGKRGSGFSSSPQLSFSAINTYLTCPLRYKLLYEDGFAVPTWHFAQFGTSLHRTLEAIHNRILQGLSVDEQMAAALFDENWISFGERARDVEEQFKRSGCDYIHRYVRDYGQTFGQIRRAELPFSQPVGECLVVGQVDLIRSRQDGSVEIVDFKTRATGGIALMRPDLQLGIYALGCESQFGQQVGQLTLHLLADSREEHFVWNPEARETVTTRLAEVANGIETRAYQPTPGPHCRECEFRALCPYREAR